MILALETSCDETSAAVIANDVVLSNIVSSQTRLHFEYGGVVPELATREHLRNLPPVVNAALTKAGIKPQALKAVAATQGPGLPNALMAGLKAAQGLAFALNVPFIGIHHHEAHLYSPWIASGQNGGASSASPSSTNRHGLADLAPPKNSQSGADGGALLRADFEAFEPNVSLIVSGGHTILVHMRAELDHMILGSTLDDAAGECFDKTAKLIGLPYPGGPEMDRLAGEGNPAAYDFPRPLLREPGDDFSFAGLKTSVRYFLQRNPAVLQDDQALRDLCASVQAAIVEVLVTKTLRAAKRLGVRCVTASGGVTCNSRLRRDLQTACDRERFKLRLAQPALCTDNAAMIGILAERKFLRGVAATGLDADALPNWQLGATAA